ncbi:hypothetical protein DFJ74DRAFT_682496 [Hyaloraphidium curvatum]|nr:hypothetical protein DFJ74DRAFT_682496 [Hyaloraphidium curvatum]
MSEGVDLLSVYRLGLYASSLSAVGAAGFALSLPAAGLGLVKAPADEMFMYLPSWLLSPSFLASTVALHYGLADPRKRHLSHLAVGFAGVYSAITTLVYSAETLSVIPGGASQGGILGSGEAAKNLFPWSMASGYPLPAIDGAGYFVQGLSTLFAGLSLPASGPSSSLAYRVMRWSLILNGAVSPSYFLAAVFPKLIFVGATWLVFVPAAMAAMVAVFAEKARENGKGKEE